LKIDTTTQYALVVVDMQRGYIDPDLRQAYPNAYVVDNGVIRNVRQLVDIAHTTGTPVVFSVIAFSDGQIESNLWIKKLRALRVLRVGSASVEVDSRLGLDTTKDHIFTKQYPSVFSSGAFLEILDTNHVTHCIFCGITMSGCVLASVMDALPHGQEPVVVGDAVADRLPLLRDVALDKVANTYGEVWSTEDTLRAMGKHKHYREYYGGTYR
jgi:nicotinamidase-related amidase